MFLLPVFIFALEPVFYSPVEYRQDDAKALSISKRIETSHLKVYIPFFPHSYIFRMINGTLLKLSDSERGWDYYYATKYKKVDDLTYDFWLIENTYFQDGSPFNANSVVENFNYFIRTPITYTDIHNRLKSVEKIDTYCIRIHLKKPYPMLINDLARISLFSSAYLKKYNWAYNANRPGKHGLGPYYVSEGYSVQRKQTSKVVLKSNPYFFQKELPYVEKLTIYTKLSTAEIINNITNKEGSLDIAFIPFNKKVEIVTSPYAKLITNPTRNNYSVHFNLIKPNGVLRKKEIRQAINQVIDQKKLLKFVYKEEGVISPYPISSNVTLIKEIMKERSWEKKRFSEKELHSFLNGLILNVMTQDIFMELWKGIEYQLKAYGVTFNYTVTSNEKEVLDQLLTNRVKKHSWDLLVWGNNDWYGNHPWNVFMLLSTSTAWSSIEKDEYLQEELEKFFSLTKDTPKFKESVKRILNYTNEQAYLLSVPSPNSVIALNKEVFFEPSIVGHLPLQNAKITPYHWSVRKKEYPKERLVPVMPQKGKL